MLLSSSTACTGICHCTCEVNQIVEADWVMSIIIQGMSGGTHIPPCTTSNCLVGPLGHHGDGWDSSLRSLSLLPMVRGRLHTVWENTCLHSAEESECQDSYSGPELELILGEGKICHEMYLHCTCINGVSSVLTTKRSHYTILINSSNVLRYICSAMFYLWDNTCHLASCQWTQSASPFVIQLAWFTTYFSPCATCHDSFFHWCSWIQVSFEHTCSPFTCSPQNVCNDQTDDVDVFSMVDWCWVMNPESVSGADQSATDRVWSDTWPQHYSVSSRGEENLQTHQVSGQLIPCCV